MMVAGFLSFPAMGLAGCYPIVDEAIKLCDTQADGRIEQDDRFPMMSRPPALHSWLAHSRGAL
jgi:hypothetical protein